MFHELGLTKILLTWCKRKSNSLPKKKLININLSKLKLLLRESFYDGDKNARHRLVDNIFSISHICHVFLIYKLLYKINSCCCSITQSCPTLCNPMDGSTPGFHTFTISWSLLKLMSIESVMPSIHLVFCCSLLLPSVFLSIRVFSKNKSALLIRWPKYWSFSFSISPSNEYSRLISFRMDWLNLLAVQGTIKSLLQYHSSKTSILWCSAFFMVQLSRPYMTTGKTIALTRRTLIVKINSRKQHNYKVIRISKQTFD